ncbi:hypothetical protein A5725_13260 [Mycobacterium kubicae]|uniref:PPE family protein n=1 Tax=Mycobacterium kubicae TaxID=120959 RepID=UPI000800E2ED|nr:PPE domain-containing protein [Mycobacterium kubicae]OBF21750.1 hypothetical protein A5725_13260 [Mycobacterium kubicae]
MSFFTLPPEINSLRMFIGAGTAPMLEAAAAWQGLAAELASAAESFASVTAGLAGQAWQGTAAAAMAPAAAPYAAWLNAAAAQSAGAAQQANAVTSMFEAARAAIIHPLEVDANRNAFVQLVMSNIFGQNAPLIALAESIYEEMWAADVAAMASYYSGAAAVAAQVVPWSSVLQTLPAIGSGISGAISAANGAAVAAAGGGGAGPAGGSAGGGGGGDAGAAAPAADHNGAAGGGGAGSGAAAPVTNAGGYDSGIANGNSGATLLQGDPSAGNANVVGGSGGPVTHANTGVGSPGISGFPLPMPMTGANSGRAGFASDLIAPRDASAAAPPTGPSTQAPEPAAAPPVEAEEAAPRMAVLPNADPDIAAKAAPGVKPQAAPATTASGIPESPLRAGVAASGTSEDQEADAVGKPISLRPEAAAGELRPQVAEEEEPQIQVRGA